MAYSRLDDVLRREHRDLIVQWVVIIALIAGLAIVIREVVAFGP